MRVAIQSSWRVSPPRSSWALALAREVLDLVGWGAPVLARGEDRKDLATAAREERTARAQLQDRGREGRAEAPERAGRMARAVAKEMKRDQAAREE